MTTGEPCAGKARQHGSGRGRRKRTPTTGTSPAAYFTLREPGGATPPGYSLGAPFVIQHPVAAAAR
jgi:hypothetical protein